MSTSTIDEYLDPSDGGDFTNDQNTLNSSAGRIHVYEHNDDGAVTAHKIKKGRTGTAYYAWATDYYGGSNANRKYLVTASYAYPDAVTSKTDASRVQASYAYTFWSGTDNVETMTTTWPSISCGENGSGSSNTGVDYWDSVGRQRWTEDELGYTNYYSYHPEHGHLAYTVRDYTVRDCDPTSLPSSADNNSTKWVTSSDGSASSNAVPKEFGCNFSSATVGDAAWSKTTLGNNSDIIRWPTSELNLCEGGDVETVGRQYMNAIPP